MTRSSFMASFFSLFPLVYANAISFWSRKLERVLLGAEKADHPAQFV
jgi:hypothetical protein